jgi:hypothetical protein
MLLVPSDQAERHRTVVTRGKEAQSADSVQWRMDLAMYIAQEKDPQVAGQEMLFVVPVDHLTMLKAIDNAHPRAAPAVRTVYTR